jgi:dTDP-4-dehydrorhamnose reductase
LKILLFGAAGLLGRHLSAELTAHGHTLRALPHPEADITDSSRLDELFAETWDAVINCAAVVNFDACENDPEGTTCINRDAPLDLASRCHKAGAVFVQFSSDYIFDGKTDRPLREEDEAHPLSVYGHQKLALEKTIPQVCPRSLVIRLSWLYGRGGRTFMSLLPDLFLKQETLRIAAGKTGSCLYARDAARWIRLLIESGHTGLFNLVNEGRTSWEEFARECLQQMHALGRNPICREILEVPHEHLGAHGAKRPRHSTLSIEKLANAIPAGPRIWTEALRDFLRESS